MKVNKVSDNIVQIVLTEEELYFDYDLNIDDLANAGEINEVSKKLVDIVKVAVDECEIETSNGMQLTIRLNQKNEIIIEAVFTTEPTEANLIGIARLFKALYNDMPKDMADEIISKTCDKMGLASEDVKKVYDILEDEDILPAEFEPKKEDNTYYILEFNSLTDIITLSKTLKELVFISSLYKLNNRYYLIINLYENKDYQLINLISEFMIKRYDNIDEAYLLEHGELIIKEWAIDRLSEI